jgi:hypothetical protein
MKWDQHNLEWKIILYSHNFDDFERMARLYPESSGFVHMIDIKWLKSHEILQRVADLKRRIADETTR